MPDAEIEVGHGEHVVEADVDYDIARLAMAALLCE